MYVDSGNQNFIKICWELAEEIAKIETYLVTHNSVDLYINLELHLKSNTVQVHCKPSSVVSDPLRGTLVFCKWLRESENSEIQIYRFSLIHVDWRLLLAIDYA